MSKNKTMSEGINKSEDLWKPYKDLHRTVNYYLCEANKDVSTAEFENILRVHKQNFIALLQNPPKNAKNREELKKGMEDGITVKEIGHQVLSKDLYQETVILSDMYDLNEFVALDLLCTAQIQMPYHYGLPRGLVAVLLYYEGRKSLAASLRLLVQARRGVAWCMDLKESLINFITAYTDKLMDNGVFNRIFELLRTLDLNNELEKLQENVALGGPRHRRQVVDLFNDIRAILAETVFLWSAQTGLPKEPTQGLINFLRQLKIDEDAAGKIDNVSFFLLLSLLSAIDLSILHIREDGEAAVQNLPILSEHDYIQTLCTEFSPSKQKWVSEGLQATATFGLAVTVSCLRLLPQCTELQWAIDKEVMFLCTAIEMKVFEFLIHKFLATEILYIDQLYMRRIHYLLTDFIVQMFPKVKELRIKADETARTMQVYAHEGLEPPANLPRHFENFMEVVTKFYSKDPLNLQYSLDYWCPIESTSHESYSYRAPPRSVSLFKFIRLAGDLVSSTLFVPFLNMLSSLSSCSQAARHCFNMLKQTGGPGFNNTMTWDHFFMSFNQYYNNLRQEVPPISDTVYRRGIHPKGITPQEIDGLQAVLRLIKTIAEHDDFSRLALCEHPGWAPLTVFLGLVGCSVPMDFKAELLLTLAALSKSPESAAQMWNNLEAAQILVTVPTTSNYQPRGIQTELDEIESRTERYPLTRALLTLLDVLTDFGIPRTLGAGPRKPGFDPYLTFIVNSVFLKFSMRAYQSNEERWLIGTMCLKLLEKFLSQYEPQLADFPSNIKPNEFNSPPGFHLMLQMNTKSEFLNLILFIIEEGQKLFQQYVPFTGEKYIEECTLRCLNILERALTLQSTFSNILSASSSPIFLTSLSKLLLIINPRSGQPDHCLNISKYVCYQYLLPKHTLAAVRILIHVTSSSTLHTQFFNILLSNEKESKMIRSGFVECLDGTTSKNDVEIFTTIKEAILKLLKQCLPFNIPNLSHFLLGFDLKHDISQTLFQQPGVLDFPRNCLHSIFTLLKCATTKGIHTPQASLLESAYNMLYSLCANHKTSEPVLRFIRQNPKFFQEHLHFCSENVGDRVTQLNQLSWLLKTIAIELKIMSNKNQTFYLQQLCRLLIGMPEQEKEIPTDTFSIIRTSKINEAANFFEVDVGVEHIKSENFLIVLLNKFELRVEEVIPPKWNFFENNALNNLLNGCQIGTYPRLIDIRKLHHTLIDELQGTTAVGQRQAIMQEIQKILLYSLSLNNAQNLACAITRYTDAWRQVVEVLVVYMPFEVLPVAEQQILDVTLLENLLTKVLRSIVLPDVGTHLSGAVLILMENLRRCHLKENQQIKKEKQSIVQSNAVTLRLILNSLVEWIMVSDNSTHNLRINLYGSLVTFLQLIHLDESVKNAQVDNSFYVSRLDTTRMQLSSDSSTIYMPVEVFSMIGEKFLELLCYDCTIGHDAINTLAMATFSLLISATGNVNWIVFMESRGYLKIIIQSILSADDELKSLLDWSLHDFKPLYLHTSKMSLLCQIAMTRVGSELLLEQKILPYLSTMKVFKAHPEILKETQLPPKGLEDFAPSPGVRYMHLFLPTLHLCNSIITSLSAQNLSAVEQIIYYLISNLEVLDYVLRTANPGLAKEFLEEIACITSVIARTASVDLAFMFQTRDDIRDTNRAHLLRVQKLTLGLLPKFLLSTNVIRDLLLSNQQQDLPAYQTSDRLLYSFQIISNLIMYARNLIANNSMDHSTFCIVFQPALGEIFSNFHSKQVPHADQSPTIGIVLQHLINTVNYYREEKGTLDFLERKIHEIPDMGNADMKEFLNFSPKAVHDVTVMREMALRLINDKLNKKKREFDYCAFIIDNAMFLLWAHLDYYMLRAMPRVRQGDTFDLSSAFNMDVTLASASEATWKVSADDISNLKQGLVSVFNDSFSRQLLETTQGGTEVKKQFIEILLRKIKRLIQFVPVK